MILMKTHLFQRCGGWWFLLAGLCLAVLPAQAQTLKAKILFFDDEDVLYRSGTTRILNSLGKHASVLSAATAASGYNNAWESALYTLTRCSMNFYASRNPRYLMYYQLEAKTPYTASNHLRWNNIVCYAYSTDGISWTKPDLTADTQFHSHPGGSGHSASQNNIVLRGVGSLTSDRYGVSMIYEPGETDANKKYKMAYTDWMRATGSGSDPSDPSKGLGLQIAYSANGTSIWRKHVLADNPNPSSDDPTNLTKIAYNQAGIDPPKVGYTTYFGPPTDPVSWRIPRSMTRFMSLLLKQTVTGNTTNRTYEFYGKMFYDGPDGKMEWRSGVGRLAKTGNVTDSGAWSNTIRPDLVLTPDDRDPATLTFEDAPVLVYKSDDQLDGPYLALHQIKDSADPDGKTQIELMTSRDGKRWTRFRKSDYNNVSVLPLSANSTAFDSKSITPCANLVVGTNIRFYYVGTPLSPAASSAIGYADIKRDRLVGIKATWAWGWRNPANKVKNAQGVLTQDHTHPNQLTGMVTLKPMKLTGIDTMKINATATGAAARVYVEVLDKKGYVEDSFTQGETNTLTGDLVDVEVKWGGSRTLANVPNPNDDHMIRIYLNNATLYSCSFYGN